VIVVACTVCALAGCWVFIALSAAVDDERERIARAEAKRLHLSMHRN